jgi:membrane-bound lytic murein transglycosylase D
VKNIVADPQRFRVDLPVIANHPYFQTVTLTRDVDVALAAKLADVRVEDFRALNPAAHKPVLLAAGTPQLLLPWDNAAVFQRNFDAYTQGQYASWTAWTVPTTMTVTDAAQRSGMSEVDLRAINNVPPRMLIKAGSTLIVPRGSRVLEDVDALVADTGHLSFQPEIVTRRTLVNAGRNDSVASIARRFRVSAASVAEWNDVKPTHAFPRGYQVVVFVPVRAAGSSRVGMGAVPAVRPAPAPAAPTVAIPAQKGGSFKKTGTASPSTAKRSPPAAAAARQPVVREKRAATVTPISTSATKKKSTDKR